MTSQETTYPKKQLIPGNDLSQDMTYLRKWLTPINQVLLDFRISELYNVTKTSFKQPYTLLPAKYIIVLLFSFFQSDFENIDNKKYWDSSSSTSLEHLSKVYIEFPYMIFTVQSGLSWLIPKSPFSSFSTYSWQWSSSPSIPGILHPVYPPLSIQYCINASQYSSCKRHILVVTTRNLK